jgi:hypothetical protein
MRKKKPSDPNKFYIQKEDLEKVVLEYQERARFCRENGQIIPNQPNVFGMYIFDLCNGLSNHPKFIRYTNNWKEAMVDDAIEVCCRAITKFDPAKITKTNNIFNYFTMIAYHAFQNRINIEKKQNYIKHKNYRELHTIDEVTGNFSRDSTDNEYTDKVITEFEEYLRKKKEKVK